MRTAKQGIVAIERLVVTAAPSAIRTEFLPSRDAIGTWETAFGSEARKTRVNLTIGGIGRKCTAASVRSGISTVSTSPASTSFRFRKIRLGSLFPSYMPTTSMDSGTVALPTVLKNS